MECLVTCWKISKTLDSDIDLSDDSTGCDGGGLPKMSTTLNKTPSKASGERGYDTCTQATYPVPIITFLILCAASTKRDAHSSFDSLPYSKCCVYVHRLPNH